jgi:two-component system, NarL family, response regulator DesR
MWQMPQDCRSGAQPRPGRDRGVPFAVNRLEMPLTLLIADDNDLFVNVLEGLLERESSIRVVARAANGEAAAQLADELGPDVVLMDLSMPNVDGFEATARILEASPGTAVVVLTGSDDPVDRERARRAGAVGYVTKDRILAELIETIRSVASGR